MDKGRNLKRQGVHFFVLLLLLVLSILCEASPGVEFSLLDLPGFAPCHLPPFLGVLLW